MAVKVVVELKARPGRRDELESVLQLLLADVGPVLKEKGSLGSAIYQSLDDIDTLVEIADWESAEAREAVVHDPATAAAMAPVLELLAEPFRAAVLQVP